MPSTWNPERYLEAMHFAARAHGDQRYPGTDISYIMHLAFVAMEVTLALQHTDDLDGDLALSCALLHDTVEDTDATLDDIEARFGLPVARGVSALTKDASLPGPERMTDSLNRILEQPPEIAVVKLADRVCNLQAPPTHWSPEKIARYHAEAREILAALGHANAWLARRLTERVGAYRAYVERA